MRTFALLVSPLCTVARHDHGSFCCWWSPDNDRSQWCSNCGSPGTDDKEEWCTGNAVWCAGSSPPSPPPPVPPSPPPPPPPPPTPASPSGQTHLTRFLNDQIDWSGDFNQVYTKGKGIMVRSPFDGLEDDSEKAVVPATFWVNDIVAPSQLYPGVGPHSGDPWCPTDYAPFDCETDDETGDRGPWNYAQLAAVVGSKMSNIFTDFDNIQAEDWGWGVFYPTDSNSVDKRCRYLASDNGFDCPGGWIPMNEAYVPDDAKKGAGWYEAGNPYAGGGGGGAGCHFNNGGIDQTNAYDSNGQNLVQDYDCQCNYAFNGDWGAWVDSWMADGIHGSGASWANDLAGCWMNNFRDMIKLQNQLWWKRWEWSDRSVPYVEYDMNIAWKNRGYWGWNEIPVSREAITDMTNWDAIMIKLPADACNSENGRHDHLSCYDGRFHSSIERAIDTYVQAGKLGVGSGAYPSSSMVLAREYMDDSGNYFREFFCESWVSPNGMYQIVFMPDDNSDGACHLDWASTHVQV